MDFMSFMGQMGSSNVPIIAAFFIGLMTAFSPCPLTTNITAVAYISRKIDDSRHTILVGLVYTLGRMVSYAGLASIIVYVGVNSREIAGFLQNYGEKALGPVLLVAGLVMFEVVQLNFGSGKFMEKAREWLSGQGYFGGFLLGMLFALAFCPFSAVLYFGMLIPLALKTGDGIIVPSVFAFATGLPVIMSSILLVKGVSKMGGIMKKTQAIERFVRRIVAGIFVAAGLYYILRMFM
ncbi:MAG: aromatic aminobenezylarsenical efflux permease ArsG family transporter [Candidatus Altiarchaeota archaeon]|nr:aromatic aminobenezylarsenical efflux permease ArsG family transporter [Candidatus Altiarchaeota archaeon]